MARVASGELPLVVTIHRAAEMRELLKGTARFKRLRLVIAGGTEAEAVADELAARSIPVIVRPIPLGANRPDEYSGHDLALAGRLADAGVRVLLGSSGGGSADLPLLASLAIGHGLDRDKALAALTTEVARTFDLSGELGSLRPGRRADLLVLDGEPLLPTTTVRYALSAGRVLISPDSRD
jgi:imidazolonepropionase-like amidohydrolase